LTESNHFEDKYHQTTLWESIRKLDLKYDFHRFANTFPMMSEEELDSLTISMEKNGYLEQYPILLFEGKILDGRNRYYLANKLNIKPIFKEFEGSRLEALDFVWSSNHNRRHLSSAQKGLAAELYRKEVEEENRKKREATQPEKGIKIGSKEHLDKIKVVPSEVTTLDSENINGKTRDIVAKQMGISHNTVDTMKKAIELEEEHPEIKEKLDRVRKGDKSVTVKSIKKEIGKIETKKKREEKLKESRENLPEHQKKEYIPEIFQQDALDFLDSIEDRSIDLLFTDPPYMTDISINISLFVNQWVPRALEKVKDTGLIYIFTGPYPREIKAYLDLLLDQERFYLSNILIWTYRNTIGPSPEYQYKKNWQAIFYLRGKDSSPLNTDKLTEKFSVLDFNAPDGRQANNYFKWQKPDDLAELIIRLSSQENDLLIDPFAGSGTFILKATEMKRYAKGSEIKSNVIEIAKKRGCIIKDEL